MIAALVPVKQLDRGKSRLFPHFDASQREAISLAMLHDVLDALDAAERVDRRAVVTPDDVVARAAREAGAEVVLYREPGLAASLEAGARALGLGADDALLVVLGDVAGATATDFDALCAAADTGAPCAVLTPSRDGGTTALLRRPPDAIAACFGESSAQRHREAAEQAGVPLHELALPSLSLDLDDANDVADFLAGDTDLGDSRAGAHTRRLLQRFGWQGASESLGIHLVPLEGIPAVQPGDDLAKLLTDAARRCGVTLEGGALVVCQKVVSKAEGRLVALADVEPSDEARRVADEFDKDPRHVEVVLSETKRIVRQGHGVLICETHHGFVCANAGVDLSNAPGADIAVLLPKDPDASAAALRRRLEDRGARDIAVVVSDTFGRPWREGLVDVAIGSAGIAPIDDARGRADLAGRELVVTAMATPDQLAAAAGLLMVKDSGIAAVWIDGLRPEGDGALADLLRDPSTDLFR